MQTEIKEGHTVRKIRIQLFPVKTNEKMDELWLPEVAEGKYFFRENEFGKLMYIEGRQGEWYACALQTSSYFSYRQGNYREIRMPVGEGVMLCHKDRNYILIADLCSMDNVVFYNYRVSVSERLQLGKANDNDIIFKNPMVSRSHAVLEHDHGNWYIQDLHSTNGTYVNGERISERELALGDVINIQGVRMIIGRGFISINFCNMLELNGMKLLLMGQLEKAGSGHFGQETGGDGNRLFNRFPRRRLPFEPSPISIEAPPMSLNSDSIPLVLRMGGSMVMGGASALSGNYIMLLSSVLFPILTQKYSEKEKKQYEERRIVGYRRYLKEKNAEIEREKQYEEHVLKNNYPDLDTVIKYPEEGKKLWERRMTDDDFLNIRIGAGDMPMVAEVIYPRQRFSIEEDVLEQEMYHLAEKKVLLKDVPIMVDLIQDFVCSVKGTKQLSHSFIKRMVMMTVLLHSYDEVKLVFLAEREDLEGELEFIKYIPHVFDDQRNIRFIATEPSEAYHVGGVIKREIEEDIKKPRAIKEILKTHPYYVVFALSKRIFDSMEVLKDAMQQEKTCGVSVVTVFDDLPKECSLLFELRSVRENAIVYLRDISRDESRFVFDRYDEKQSRDSMKRISNISLKNIAQTFSLPKAVTFLEMFGAGRIEHLNVAKRWAENNPIKSIAAPIGVMSDGSLFYLDLHQEYQGPHGLVAGTTGSGKSEFLVTYILSMAINYHPDEVAFVLIDYKGGGLAGAFDDADKGIHLPHLVGTITNLDGSSIQRSLISIQSELMRRERMFIEAKRCSDEVTMDIYTYQKLYRNKVVSEPMPHLFIIADEFAELKQQQPDFMDQLISAARIGRSLGVHLILATQKPAGVVNDQIRSNTKFRICLKVQDKADSMDMLKRPEAAELKETGRFYLQVGYNEYFALGQSAWSGADYEPQDEVVSQKDDSLQVLDPAGQTILEVKPLVERRKTQGTQLAAIVKMLTEVSRSQNIVPRQLWTPELKKRIDLREIDENREKTEEIICTLGMLDDPENQKQLILNYNFEQCHHLLIAGEAGTGKTSLLQMILYSVSKRYSSGEVNYYILDYSSRMLKKFEQLPHCGAVLLEDDFPRLDSFFEIINKIVAERKRLFLELGVDNYTAAKKRKKLPLILVVVDNYSVLGTSKAGEKYSYSLQGYLKESANYGVKYLVTCNHLNELSSRIKQEFGDRLCLHLKDKYEYGEALNCRVSYIPPELPGRGLYYILEKPMELQTAMLCADLKDEERLEWLDQELLRMEEHYTGWERAVGMPVVSETATYEMFARQFPKGRIPLGYAMNNNKSVALPFKQFFKLSVYQGNEKGRIPILENLLMAVSTEGMKVWFIKKQTDSYADGKDFVANEKTRYISVNQGEVKQFCMDLKDEIVRRVEFRNAYCSANRISEDKEVRIEASRDYMCENTEALLILFEDFGDFCVKAGEDKMSTILFDKLLGAAGLNIYQIAFFRPEIPEEPKKGYLYSGYNPDGPAMLFGGLFGRQSAVLLPDELAEADREQPFNRCLMKYRDAYYVLTMPCGELQEEEQDPDSLDIFK